MQLLSILASLIVTVAPYVQFMATALALPLNVLVTFGGLLEASFNYIVWILSL